MNVANTRTASDGASNATVGPYSSGGKENELSKREGRKKGRRREGGMIGKKVLLCSVSPSLRLSSSLS